jgi:hypothetical protein
MIQEKWRQKAEQPIRRLHVADVIADDILGAEGVEQVAIHCWVANKRRRSIGKVFHKELRESGVTTDVEQ